MAVCSTLKHLKHARNDKTLNPYFLSQPTQMRDPPWCLTLYIQDLALPSPRSPLDELLNGTPLFHQKIARQVT